MYISSDATEDFTIESSNLLGASSNTFQLFLGPTVSQACFTISTINDAVPEIETKTFSFFIQSFVDGLSIYQVLSTASTRSVILLDDDCKCINHGLTTANT